MARECESLLPRHLVAVRGILARSDRAAGRPAGGWTFGDSGGIRAHLPRTDNRPRMKQFLLKVFTWWNGQTFGTQLWTSRYGELVGTDEQGNRYYRTKGGKIDPTLQRVCRSNAGAAGLARLDASHCRRPADRAELHGAGVGEAARAEHDRHSAGLSPVRLDAGERPPPQGNRRLPRLDAR
jgi:hypothetical protein